MQFIPEALAGFKCQKLLVVALFSLVACSPVREYDFSVPEPMVSKQPSASAKHTADSDQRDSDSDSGSAPTSVGKSKRAPQPPTGATIATALAFEKTTELTGEPIALDIVSLPLPAFINEVYGNQLGLSFHLDPRLETKKDLVTLHIEEPLSPQELYRTAQDVLLRYGVSMRNNGILIQFEFSPQGLSTEPPIMISGEALPTVPSTHRPVFYLMDLKVVQAQRAVGWLAQAFEGQKAKFRSDPERNAVWLQGSLEIVKQAVEVVKLVDQPLMRGRNSLRIEPRYLGADQLSKRLVEVLTAQGYHATLGKYGAVSFFVISETNRIIAFANDDRVLPLVEAWVDELDQPLKQTNGDNIFYYEVQNASAASMVETLNQLRGGSSTALSTSDKDSSKGSSTVSTGQLVVDHGRNALLFSGTNTEWVTLLPVIEKLDKQPLQVLVEVIVAEVTLSDSFSFGIDWAINNTTLGVDDGFFDDALADTVSIVDGNLTYFPISSSGATRAVLNMLATDNRVNILQTPRLLVRSGEEARINVGNEIPIVSSEQSSEEGGAITQSIQYRSTGNSLTVRPVVFSGGQVDLIVSQELSNSVPDDNNATPSPTIFTRNISTTLTIHDGGSVLVGGLINTLETDDENKVPFLGDIPWLGKALFTSTARATERTELMILIAPYIVSNASDAQAITEAFKAGMSEIE